VRTAVTALAETHAMPAENLIPPDSVRRLAWTPPEVVDAQTVQAALSGSGARAWQVALVTDTLVAALAEAPATSPPA